MTRNWLLGGAVLALVVSACGGGGDGAPAAESPPSVTGSTSDEPAADENPGADEPADEPAADENPGADEPADEPAATGDEEDGGFTPLAPGEGVTVGASGTEVTSDDGRLVLSFPAGAVADDTVVAVESLADVPDELEGLDATSLVYRLEPSGLTFEQPVTFTLTTDLVTTDDGLTQVPLVILIGDDATGEPVGLDTELDPDAGVAVVSGAIEHFSMIVAHWGALAVGLEQVTPNKRKLGEPWEADTELRNTSALVMQSGEELDLVVTDVVFDSAGAVEVEGSASHPGFPLPARASRKLDFPVPRWQCANVGEGSYGVVAKARLTSALVVAIKEWIWDDNTSWVVHPQAKVTCELPLYNASGGGERLSVSGQVDITKPFTLNGAIVGGTVALNFTPAGWNIDSEAKLITSDGTFTYSGGGSDATISGSGSYTISGPIGKPLRLNHNAGGCANPGECKDTEGDIILTPVE